MSIKKLFGELNMSWLTVILFALITGVYTGIIMSVPFLKETSFQDIGISYEWWVLFAVIIVVNCEKPIDAMLKCFVFFLISQPVIFGVEVLLHTTPLEDAVRYYVNIWFIPTLLTLPGGLVAHFCKKENVIGSIILGLGNAIVIVHILAFAVMTLRAFPHHLLSCIFCVAEIVIMTLCIQKEKKHRIIAWVVPVILLGLALIFLALTGRHIV